MEPLGIIVLRKGAALGLSSLLVEVEGVRLADVSRNEMESSGIIVSRESASPWSFLLKMVNRDSLAKKLFLLAPGIVDSTSSCGRCQGNLASGGIGKFAFTEVLSSA